MTLNESAEQAIHQFLLEEKREAIRRETAVFPKMYPQVQTHFGQYIAIMYKQGLSPEEINGELPLTLAQIYAALTYYHLNEEVLMPKYTLLLSD